MSLKLIETCAYEYAARLPNIPIAYNRVEFARLNAWKTDRLRYCLLVDKRVSGGIIFGDDGTTLSSPFSAPFGGVTLKGNSSLGSVGEMVSLLSQFGSGEDRSVQIILPPEFYQPRTSAKWVYELSRVAKSHDTLINNHFDCQDDPMAAVSVTGGQKLRAALRLNYSYDSEASPEEAYEVIRANRQAHGYPLHMTLDRILDTARLIPADWHMLSVDGEAAASALVYHCAPEIVQVIYWGDRPGMQHLRVMNLLAYRIFEHYRNLGTRIIDIGPSGDFEAMSPGLLEFKESVGCRSSLKHRFCL